MSSNKKNELQDNGSIKFPLHWKINALIAGTAAGLALLVLLFLYFFVSDRLVSAARDDARSHLETLVDLIRPELLTYNTSSIRTFLDHQVVSENYLWLTVFDEGGSLLEGRVVQEGDIQEIESRWIEEPHLEFTVRQEKISVGQRSEKGWIFIIPIRPTRESSVWGYLYAGVSMTRPLIMISRIRWVIVFSLLVAILLGWSLTIIWSRRITRPITDLVEQTRIIAAGDLGHRLEGGGQDEIGVLYRSFDQMQTALMKSYDELRMINISLEERVRSRTRQVQQLQRLDSIGTLAGGIAHNFNNLLGIVLGYSELLLRHDDIDEKHRSKIEQIRLSAVRGSELTEQLLGFARKGTIKVKPLNINRIVGEVVVILRETMDPKVRIDIETCEGSVIVNGDESQLRQVVLNLLLNSRDAVMPEGGHVVVDVELVDSDPTVSALMDSNAGKIVKVEVKDDGCGMDEKTIERVFEPFFTTKESGSGIGLGLSTAYGIVKNHGGAVFIDSDHGDCTSVKIYLPVSEVDIEQKPQDDGEDLPRSLTKDIVVLLVDDKEEVLSIFSEGLGDLGYRCITSPGGREAIREFDAVDGAVGVAVIDLIMPEMDGEELFMALRERVPDLPVIIASGYSDNTKAQNLIEAGANAYIRKPFSLSKLVEEIERVIR